MRSLRVCLAILVLLSSAACGRKVATIDISPKKARIYGVGNGQRMTARLLDKKGQPIEQGSITWSSSKPEVLSIDGSGRATAKGGGKAMITAKFEQVSSQVPVEVIDVKTIDVIPPSLQLVGPPGTRFPLQSLAKNSKGAAVGTSVQWSSSKSNVVAVDSRGELTSIGPGTATVMAKLGDLQSACDVTVVLHDLARLELRPATAILHAGEIQKFEVVGFGTDGKPIEGLAAVFQSSDPRVAKVDALGLATSVAPGTASIHASVAAVSADATLLVN